MYFEDATVASWAIFYYKAWIYLYYVDILPDVFATYYCRRWKYYQWQTAADANKIVTSVVILCCQCMR